MLSAVLKSKQYGYKSQPSQYGSCQPYTLIMFCFYCFDLLLNLSQLSKMTIGHYNGEMKLPSVTSRHDATLKKV